MRRLAIVGAGGHGRVVAEIAAALGCYGAIAFLDDGSPEVTPEHPVLGTSSRIDELAGDWDFVVAIGRNATRRRIAERIGQAGGRLVTLVHPAAVVSPSASLGVGTVVMAGAVINAGARIGRGCIVNTCASVDHDCTVGDFTHVSVGARLAGGVTVGEDCFICAGATVINNVRVADGCIVAAGAAVIGDLTVPGLYAGVPARRSLRSPEPAPDAGKPGGRGEQA